MTCRPEIELDLEYSELERKENVLKCVLSPDQQENLGDLMQEHGRDLSGRLMIVSNICESLDDGTFNISIRELRQYFEETNRQNAPVCAAI